MGTLYTVGHSSNSIELFMELLGKHAIQVLVDVRSDMKAASVTTFR